MRPDFGGNHGLRPMTGLFAVLAGALLLAWPALLNFYPILFSDTHAFLVQAGQPRMVWDKPWVYGPFLHVLHQGISLWLPLAAQVLILSHLLFAIGGILGPRRPLDHVLLCLVLAIGSAAPWYASLLMPDIFAPVAVLCVFGLACGERLGRGLRIWMALLGIFAVASHLSHLLVAAACIAAVAVLRWRRTGWAALPLLGAVAILLATNMVGYGRFALSPYGSVFALARLVADGPAADTIRAECPQSGWLLCAWADRLPANSDDFLWDGKGPVWTAPDGPAGLAPEAGAILRQTVLRDPLGVARVMAANAGRQLVMTGLGDVLRPDWLEQTVLGSLRAYLAPAEQDRFFAARQMRGTLVAAASPFNLPHAVLLGLGAAATIVLALRRQDRLLAAFSVLVLAGVLANAVATGALSGPHQRYQARIAWLLLLPPLYGYRRALRASR
jgi:hypothetical protein